MCSTCSVMAAARSCRKERLAFAPRRRAWSVTAACACLAASLQAASTANFTNGWQLDWHCTRSPVVLTAALIHQYCTLVGFELPCKLRMQFVNSQR